jgi:hypothetical protein
LRLEHMLYLKRLFDPHWFDQTLLQNCSVKILPEGRELPVAFLSEYQQRRGLTRKAINV